MNIDLTNLLVRTMAQATYGEENYGSQIYSCGDGNVNCDATVPVGPGNNPGTTATTPGAPNTGFLGMSQDAAVFAIGGSLLMSIALVGAIFLAVRNRKRNKNNNEG